jgi:iron-sulfur cluster insertion protein
MLELTNAAAKKLVSRICKKSLETSSSFALDQVSSKSPKERFRIKVIGGGCSGYQYKFLIDQLETDYDIFLGSNELDFEIVVDKHSLPFINGSILDHSSSLSGEHFFLKNPNAKAKCGCGSSFSV